MRLRTTPGRRRPCSTNLSPPVVAALDLGYGPRDVAGGPRGHAELHSANPSVGDLEARSNCPPSCSSATTSTSSALEDPVKQMSRDRRGRDGGDDVAGLQGLGGKKYGGGWGNKKHRAGGNGKERESGADEDTVWKMLTHFHKPLFWKLNVYREQLEYSYGNFFAQWVLFFNTCVVAASARVYYCTRQEAAAEATATQETTTAAAAAMAAVVEAVVWAAVAAALAAAVAVAVAVEVEVTVAVAAVTAASVVAGGAGLELKSVK